MSSSKMATRNSLDTNDSIIKMYPEGYVINQNGIGVGLLVSLGIEGKTLSLFEKYSTIRSSFSGSEIGVSFIALGSDANGYDGYVIFGHSDGWDIVQKPGDDRVYITCGVKPTDQNDGEFVCYEDVYQMLKDDFFSK